MPALLVQLKLLLKNGQKVFLGDEKYQKNHTKSVHEGKKPYQSSICDENFNQLADLKIHIESVHEGKILYQCCNCDSNFAVKVDLKVHAESAYERFAEKLDIGIHMNLFMKRRNHFNVQFVIQTLLS